MAGTQRAGANARKKPGKLRYFYLEVMVDGQAQLLLHKTLHINRAQDIITTWCYPLAKRVAYTYSDTKKRRQHAFSTQEVAKMLNRRRLALECAILEGNIETPQHTYGIDEHKRKFQYLWSEKDILGAHAYFSTVHRGRPRKDGLVTPQRLPNVRELRAMIRQEDVLYVKMDNGEFLPVWRAPDFE